MKKWITEKAKNAFARPVKKPSDGFRSEQISLGSPARCFLLFAFLLSTFCFLLPFSAHAATTANIKNVSPGPVISRGLVGWWMLDSINGVADLSSGHNNGTAQGGITIGGSRDHFGLANKAAGFVGASSQYVDFSNINGFSSFVSGGNFTFSVWVKTNSASTRQEIAADFNSGGSNQSFLVEFGGYQQDVTHITTNLNGSYLDSNYVYPVGQWIHVVVTRDSSTRTIYINGIRKNSDSNVSMGTGVKMALGRAGAYDGLYLNGAMSDVRIYNRALSASEIKTLYNSAATKISAPLPLPNSTNGITASIPQNLKNGLVGWWMLDNLSGATDLSGQSNNGAGQGGITIGGTTNRQGQTNRATTFTNTKNITVADSASTQVTRATVSMWVKPTTVSSAQTLLNKWGASSGFMQAGLDVYLSSSGNAGFLWQNPGIGQIVSFTGNTAFVAGNWYHVAWTYDGTTAKIYVNGVLDGSATAAHDPPTWLNNQNLVIGSETNGNTPFTGSMSDVRFYNRALSAAEIKQLYQSVPQAVVKKVPPGPLSQGLVGYWKLDKFNGAKDLSGSGYNGAGQGGVTIGATDFNGVANKATTFDGGSTSWISMGNVLDAPPTFTISTWVMSNSAGQNNKGIVAKDDNVSKGYMLWAYGGGQFNFTTNETDNLLSGVVPTVGVWYQVVGTFDGTTKRIYVNGALKGFQAGSAPLSTSPNPFLIGTYAFSASRWNGKIGETRFYNRAISPSEVLQLYNTTK